MPLNTLYQANLYYMCDGEEMMNVFFYEKNDAAYTAEQLRAAFNVDVVENISPILNADITIERLRIINLGDLSDFDDYIYSSPISGEVAGARLPIKNAVNFTLYPSSRALKPGSKRFPAVPVSVTTDDYIDDAGYITALNTLKTALGAVIIEGGATEGFTPVIVKRAPYTTEEGNDAYRVPQTGDPLVYSAVKAVSVNLRISSQGTRGNGR